jgi:hypothetical protein
MGTGYATEFRVLDEWWYGPVGLMCCEVNPRSGPPDFCFAGETRSVERWFAPALSDPADYEPAPHEETYFSLLLVSTRGDILFEDAYKRLEWVQEKTEQVRRVLQPLADDVAEKKDVD